MRRAYAQGKFLIRDKVTEKEDLSVSDAEEEIAALMGVKLVDSPAQVVDAFARPNLA